ncbi:MAG: hypothetical protein AAF225_13560 [Pseudomonadota bacterium]
MTWNGRLIARWVLAGPVTLLIAILLMAATPFWFPKGASNIDHLVFGILLFPAYWAVPFTFAIMADKLWRATGILAGTGLISILMIVQMFNQS